MKKNVITFVALILAAALMSACGSAGVQAISGNDPVKAQIAAAVVDRLGNASELRVTNPGQQIKLEVVEAPGNDAVNLIPLLVRTGLVETRNIWPAYNVYLTPQGLQEAQTKWQKGGARLSSVMWTIPGTYSVEVERYTEGEHNNINAEVTITFTPYPELAAKMVKKDHQRLTVRRTAILVQFNDGLKLASLRSSAPKVQVGSL